MKRAVSGVFGGAIGIVVCVATVLAYAFLTSGNVEAARDKAENATVYAPTARDLTVFERRLHRTSRNSPLAETCGRGTLLGGAEIHVATKFPAVDQNVTADAPDVARVDVKRSEGAPKALILESLYPTLWTVTGAPDVIILMGGSVIADYPEGTQVFAPKFVEGCANARWVKTPDSIKRTAQRGLFASLVHDPHSGFSYRAKQVARGLFDRDHTSWMVRRDDTVMRF